MDIANVNTNLSTYIATTQSDISTLQQQLQDMQHISDTMGDLYAQTQSMMNTVRADISQIKQSADIHRIYAMQWRMLYAVVLSGESYAQILPTLTLPKTARTQQAWDILTVHKNGIIPHTEIRKTIDKNAFIITPAVIESQITENTPLMQRIRAKITHFIFVVHSPNEKHISQNTTLQTLYTALDNSQMDVVLDILKPLQIDRLTPLLQRLEQRQQVLQALQTIWENLPHTTPPQDKGTE